MPDLSAFGDVDEVDNRYIGKCVVYVEGEDDRNVWERVVGIDIADRLEFKVPVFGGAGSEAVLRRVRTERQSNARIFGLVDGEVAAQFGEVVRLIECADVLFELELPECEGIMFLGAHELENVLVRHSRFSNFVERNVRLRDMGSRNKEDIEIHIVKQARRFYIAALIKYAWSHLYFQGVATGIGDVDHFRSERGIMVEIREAKQRISREFADGGREFRCQVVKIGRWTKQHMDGVRRAGGNANGEVVRLAEGKGLLGKLRNRWRLTTANDGLLVERVCLSMFAERLREKLLEITDA